MKTKLFSFFFTFFLCLILLLPQTYAQNYTTLRLSEFAKGPVGSGSINSIQFSPDGKLLAVASSTSIWIYDVDTSKELYRFIGHVQTVSSIAFSPNSKMLASGSWDQTVRLWDPKKGTHLRTLTGHTGRVHSVAFSPNGRTLASSGADKIVRLWDTGKGTHKHDLIGHTAEVYSVAFSPNGRTLASGGWDATIRLWDTGKGTHKQTLRRRTDRFSSVAFTPDGQILVSVGGRQIRLWDLSTGRVTETLTGRHTDSVSSISISRDGQALASGSRDTTIRVWELPSGKYRRSLMGHTGSISSVSFSPDGKALASRSGTEIRLWDLSAGIFTEGENEFNKMGKRTGFIWGIGVGTGTTSYTQSLVEYWGTAYEGPTVTERGRESAFVTDIRIGHGFSEQFLLYYTSRITWLPLRNLYKDTMVANGTAGVGLTIYPLYKYNFYLTGSVGLATLATWFPPFELDQARATGMAVSAGIGYEFFRHCSLDLTVSFGNASAKQIEQLRLNEAELTNEVVTVILTLNGLAY